MMKKIVLAMLILTSCTKPSFERNIEQARKIQELQEEEQMLLEKRDQQLEELEMVDQALSDSAIGLYASELKFLNIAKGIQSEIERLQAKGEDTSSLEVRREASLKRAEDLLLSGLDAEYFARYEEDRVTQK